MKISELRNGMNNVNLKAKVVELSQPKEILTKFGTTTTLTVATLKDDSGSIKLTLWGKSSEGIEEGNEVELTKGFVKEFREELQLSVGRGGAVKILE